MSAKTRIREAVHILRDLGVPREQQNDRTALCLLALLDIHPRNKWCEAEAPMVGITPMMEFAHTHYGVDYAPNTRETFRRFSVHQLMQAGIVVQNPDHPSRPVNSPKTVYQMAPDVWRLLKTWKSRHWKSKLSAYRAQQEALATRYARLRDLKRVPVRMAGARVLHLTPGAHSQLIQAVVEQFASRFVPGGQLLYVGDTGKKWTYRDGTRFLSLGIQLDEHGKMPDVVIHDRKRNWLVLVEVVTSHGPVNPKRHEELHALFAKSRVGLVFVTAFPSRIVMSKYWNELAWETEVWVADHPDHMIHLNGSRFLGPYGKPGKKGISR